MMLDPLVAKLREGLTENFHSEVDVVCFQIFSLFHNLFVGRDLMQDEVGGEGGIRTHETLLTPTRVPGVRLQPLGHLSAKVMG